MRGFRGHKFRRRTLILWFCLGILTGVGLARGGRVASSVWPSFLAPVCLLACSRRSVPSLLLIIFLGLSLGLWRGSIYMRKLGDYDRVEKQKISLTARASEDAVYGDTSQLTFKASHVILDGGQALAGNIQLSGFGVNAVYEGDEVAASGELYPAQGSVQARMSYARLSLLAHHPSVIAEIRRKFAAGTQTALPEPLAPFAMGLLIGQRSDLPDNVKQDLLMVGLTHIIAVSGYNLTIILHASRRLLGKRSKRISFYCWQGPAPRSCEQQ
jgi:competence protein ComEC